jgi:acetyl esterase/lipase
MYNCYCTSVLLKNYRSATTLSGSCTIKFIDKSMRKITTLAILLFLLPLLVEAQEIIDLYTGIIPNSKVKATKETESSIANGMYRKSTFPTLEVFLADKTKSTGTAVIICPGGGYSVIVYDGEGVSTAKELAKSGVTAFVLKYRLPNDSTMEDKTIGPLQDAQQARIGTLTLTRSA